MTTIIFLKKRSPSPHLSPSLDWKILKDDLRSPISDSIHIHTVLSCGKRNTGAGWADALKSLLDQKFMDHHTITLILDKEEFDGASSFVLDQYMKTHPRVKLFTETSIVDSNGAVAAPRRSPSIFNGSLNRSPDFVLFLDECEHLASNYSLLIMTKALLERKKAFVYTDYWTLTNQLQRNLIQYNPFDVLAPPSLQHTFHYQLFGENAENDYSLLDRIPLTTSMMMRFSDFEGVHSGDIQETAYLDEGLVASILQTNGNISPNVLFWLRMALSGLNGYYVVTPLLRIDEARLAEIRKDLKTAAIELPKPFAWDLGFARFKRVYRPLVSVIVPFFNVENSQWFEEMICALARQTMQDFEVVVVNDGSDLRVSLDIMNGIDIVVDKNGNSVWRGGFLNRKLACMMDNTFGIPFRILHHSTNLGLASARNTGVVGSRGQFIYFLDPDDFIDATALEKLALVAIPSLGFPIKHLANKVLGFIYSGTNHFEENGIAPKAGVNSPVYSSYQESKLTKENFLTSAAMIAKDTYLEYGGNCERSKVKLFEDYDFWCRLASLGVRGQLLREPLFWYRRHSKGNSARIQSAISSSKSSFSSLGEIRKNNPVLFGDMLRSDLNKLWKSRTATWANLQHFRGTHAAVLNHSSFLPCYTPHDFLHPSDAALHQILDRFSVEEFQSYSAIIGNASPHFRALQHHKATLGLSRYIPSVRQNTDYTETLFYFIPWMVTGGADLYDLHVIEALARDNNITLIVDRHIPHHPWRPKFQSFVSEIFELQTMTNNTETMFHILDHLYLTRQPKAIILTRSACGYDFIPHFRDGPKPDVSIWNSNVPIVDINHLYMEGDRTGWEWRSGQHAVNLTKRIVVSQNLRNYFIENIRLGDDVLGVAEDDSHWRRQPLNEAERDKVEVIYPPIDLRVWESGMKKELLSSEYVERSATRRRTVFYVGRIDEQKNPHLWLDVVDELASRDGKVAPVIIGAGPQARQIFQKSRTMPSLVQPGNTSIVRFLGQISHELIPFELTKSHASVLLLTSRYEGVPIAILEALSIGLPVVALDCGGSSEIVQYLVGDSKRHLSVQTYASESLVLELKVIGPLTLVRSPTFNSCSLLAHHVEHDQGSRNYLINILANATSQYLDETSVSGLKGWKARYEQMAILREVFGWKSFQSKWQTLMRSIL